MDREAVATIGYPLGADHDLMGQKQPGTGLEDGTPYQQALSALGAGLKQQREARSIDLPELARKLYLPIEQLEALEAGDQSRLPEPVYVIAQARRVGLALGLSDDSTIKGLEEVIRNSRSQQLRHPLTRPPEPHAQPRGSEKRLFRPAAAQAGPLSKWLVGTSIACGAVVLLGLAIKNQDSRSPAPSTLRPATLQPAMVEAATGHAAKLQASRQAVVAAGQIGLSSTAPSWLEVRNPAGQTLFRGTLNGSKQFPLGSGLAVIAGRPDLVQVRVGQAPARQLGRIDQVSWQRFGPNGGKAR